MGARAGSLYNYGTIALSAKSRLKARPDFAHLLPQWDKAVLYPTEGRSYNLKIISGKPDNFQADSL